MAFLVCYFCEEKGKGNIKYVLNKTARCEHAGYEPKVER